MENIDVIGLLNAGYASPSMSAMTPPPTVNAIPSGLLSSGEAVTVPMNTIGMYNLLGDVPFSVSPGGEVYTPPQIPQFNFPIGFNPFGTIDPSFLANSPLFAGVFDNIGSFGSPF